MVDSADRRGAPRFEVIAQANVASGEETYLLPVRNISTTGAFLEGDPAEHPDLELGTELKVTLSASDPSGKVDEVIDVQCRARVARIDARRAPRSGGFGITLEPAGQDDAGRLRALVGRLAHLPPPRPDPTAPARR
jgi:hypothetical protein